MRVAQRLRSGLFWTEVLILLLAIVFMAPFYLVLVNSVKTVADMLMNTASWPEKFVWENYGKAWRALRFPTALSNSVFITVFSNIGVTIIAALTAYRMVRKPTKFNSAMFFVFVASMVIPFQSIMIPLVQVMRTIGLTNSLSGVAVTYWGLGLSFTIFLFHGFIKTISLEIEEAAVVDGCGAIGVFWRIVFPLLRPMTVSVVLLNTLWFWNDFLLPNLMLQKADQRTIQTAMSAFFGQFLTRWDLALPALVLGTAPAVVFFLIVQRQIIEGVSGGAVKG
ncbi:carbohydrate ABC transporter permease [Cohnella sp.]|uniref:carbohydrate ABC transporter permease n=1 Tax=Cohnella sp. TaxID=1883426 RepID=UPI00356661FB